MDVLKQKLTTAPSFQYPDFTQSFALTTDASNKAIGPYYPKEEMVKICQHLTPAELNYSTTDKELLAIVWAVSHYRLFLYGRQYLIVTDHKPLTNMFNVNDPSSRLMRSRIKLEDYDYKIVYKAGKINCNAEALSRSFKIEIATKKIIFGMLKKVQI